MHNVPMTRFTARAVFILLFCSPLLWAQDEETTAPEGGSSQQVEQSDEDFRRRMELEDARSRDPGFADPIDTYKPDLEKIDKLPEESRDNIRDQLIDVIMEEGEWEPGDALKEYPYTPSATAEGDPELKQQEQEAWDEQIEKYHERESEAYGAYRGPVPGPGNPDGQEGGEQGGEQGQQGGQQGSGQGDQQGDGGEQGEDQDAGTYEYQPGGSSSSDANSTAGVSESALDFLRGRQSSSAGQQGAGQQQASEGQSSQDQSQQAQSQQNQAQQDQSQQAPTQQDQEQDQQQDPQSALDYVQQQSPQEQADQQSDPQQQQDPSQEPPADTEPDTRGIIAIQDLDKLRGNTAAPPPPEEEEEDP